MLTTSSDDFLTYEIEQIPGEAVENELTGYLSTVDHLDEDAE